MKIKEEEERREKREKEMRDRDREKDRDRTRDRDHDRDRDRDRDRERRRDRDDDDDRRYVGTLLCFCTTLLRKGVVVVHLYTGILSPKSIFHLALEFFISNLMKDILQNSKFKQMIILYVLRQKRKNTLNCENIEFFREVLW